MIKLFILLFDSLRFTRYIKERSPALSSELHLALLNLFFFMHLIIASMPMSTRRPSRLLRSTLLAFSVPITIFTPLNFFFLVITVSQFIPALKVGFLFTYVAPLAFVLCVTIAKEAFDDFQRMRKDKDINNKKYE